MPTELGYLGVSGISTNACHSLLSLYEPKLLSCSVLPKHVFTGVQLDYVCGVDGVNQPTCTPHQAISLRLTAQEGITVRIQPSTRKTVEYCQAAVRMLVGIELFAYVQGLHRSSYELLFFSRKLKDAVRSTRRHFWYDNARFLAYLRED